MFFRCLKVLIVHAYVEHSIGFTFSSMARLGQFRVLIRMCDLQFLIADWSQPASLLADTGFLSEVGAQVVVPQAPFHM